RFSTWPAREWTSDGGAGGPGVHRTASRIRHLARRSPPSRRARLTRVGRIFGSCPMILVCGEALYGCICDRLCKRMGEFLSEKGLMAPQCHADRHAASAVRGSGTGDVAKAEALVEATGGIFGSHAASPINARMSFSPTPWPRAFGFTPIDT